MAKRLLVSVIVPVYNGEKYVRSCLQGLLDQTLPREQYEVIVVDNMSTDRGKEIAAAQGVKVVKESRRGSYAARNAGIAASRGEILAFTDVDCVVGKSWLEKALQHLRETGDNILAGGVEFYTVSGEPWTVWGFYDSRRFLNQEINYRKNAAATANLFVKKDLFYQVGTFDGSLLSGGDVAWVEAAVQKGARLGYSPEVKVYHPVRNSFREVAQKCFRVGQGKGQGARNNRQWFYLLSPRHLSPGPGTLRRLCGGADSGNSNGSGEEHAGSGEAHSRGGTGTLFLPRMLGAVYLLNAVEYAGKVKGFLAGGGSGRWNRKSR